MVVVVCLLFVMCGLFCPVKLCFFVVFVVVAVVNVV